MAAGLALSFVFPVNKKLWSPSFVLVVGGISFVLFSLFYWVIDVRGWRKWAFFFTVIGMNAITIYVLQWFVDFRRISRFFLGGVASLLPQAWGDFVLACGYVAACWLVLLFLYRKKVFLKV